LIVRADCRHFPGDRPCEYHKAGEVSCGTCDRYAPRGKAILIVKFDAVGDVLRTTSILPSLHREYGRCYITWITSPAAHDLFVGNGLVHEVLSSPADYLPTLLNRNFDIIINPDASRRSCEIASLARGKRKFGFTASPGGVVVPLNQAATDWLDMGGCDDTKKKNSKTYQQILHEMCDIGHGDQRIVLHLTDEEQEARSVLALRIGIDTSRPVIGINTGAGEHWRLKKWRLRGFIDLIDLIIDTTDAQVMLLGGEAERRRNKRIKAHFGQRVSNPAPGDLREFIRLIDLCDVIVTGDTLALHIALGRRKRVAAVFGPTSAAEIDLYGLGIKIVPDIECICCYKTDCDRRPNCMELVSSRQVFSGVMEQLKALSQISMPGPVTTTQAREYSVVGEPGR
jgi:ADP-heptose:LPS heptosyltransferase